MTHKLVLKSRCLECGLTVRLSRFGSFKKHFYTRGKLCPGSSETPWYQRMKRRERKAETAVEKSIYDTSASSVTGVTST